MDELAQKLIAYSQAHWHADIVPDSWQVKIEDYPALLELIIKDLTRGKAPKKVFVRIAGQSGSGKSTQLLPAVQAMFEKQKIDPILLAARLLVPYHPYAKDIEAKFGHHNLRENTNEFTSAMLGIVTRELIRLGYPIILDVSFFNLSLDRMLAAQLNSYGYDSSIQMVATSKEISDTFIAKRAKASTHVEKNRLVNAHTSIVFFKSTIDALNMLSNDHPDTQITLWSAWDKLPIYDGRVGDSEMLAIYQKYLKITKIPNKTDEEALRVAKVKHLAP
jgi:Excinuclease ATPase subunit